MLKFSFLNKIEIVSICFSRIIFLGEYHAYTIYIHAYVLIVEILPSIEMEKWIL